MHVYTPKEQRLQDAAVLTCVFNYSLTVSLLVVALQSTVNVEVGSVQHQASSGVIMQVDVQSAVLSGCSDEAAQQARLHVPMQACQRQLRGRWERVFTR